MSVPTINNQFTRTLVVSPTSAQNNISLSNWSSTNNALNNWLNVTQDPNDSTLWDFVLSANNSPINRQTTVTVTHPDDSNTTQSFDVSQSGTGTVPPVINNFTAVEVGSDEIETLWDGVTGATGNLTITWGTGGSYTNVGSGTSNDFNDGSFNLESLSPNTTYYIRMTATNAEASMTVQTIETTATVGTPLPTTIVVAG